MMIKNHIYQMKSEILSQNLRALIHRDKAMKKRLSGAEGSLTEQPVDSLPEIGEDAFPDVHVLLVVQGPHDPPGGRRIDPETERLLQKLFWPG
jgi:hypothetical protein